MIFFSKIPLSHLSLTNGITLTLKLGIPENFGFLKKSFLRFVRSFANSVYNFHNPKRIKLLAVSTLVISAVTNLNIVFKIYLIPWALVIYRKNQQHWIPVGNYMFKVSNRNTRTRCEICSELTIKITERCHWRRSGIFIVNFEHITHLLVFLLLTLSR